MLLSVWPGPPKPVQILIVGFLGLVLGSFSTALSHRAGRGDGWVKGRSHCPSCNATLSLADLIPLFSWLILRGRCRHCGASISVRYPLIELSVLAACLGIYAVYGFTPAAFVAMAAMPFLMALFLIDLETFLLPDKMQIILAFLGLPFIILTAENIPASLLSHSIAAVLFALLVWVTGKASVLRAKKNTRWDLATSNFLRLPVGGLVWHRFLSFLSQAALQVWFLAWFGAPFAKKGVFPLALLWFLHSMPVFCCKGGDFSIHLGYNV